MIVLGIDPGTERVGYGVVKKQGGGLQLVSAGILKIKSGGLLSARGACLPASPTRSARLVLDESRRARAPARRASGGDPAQNKATTLLEIKNGVSRLIHKFKPEVLATEKLYFSKNQKTAMGVAEARGVILLAALENNLKIQEYSPNEVKAGVAGHGLADKRAVLKMVRLILREPNLKVIDDASDALALAILGASNVHNIHT